MVLISNSSLTETRGMVNGYGQALCSIGCSLGPVVGAPLFAWSEGTGIKIHGCTVIKQIYSSLTLVFILPQTGKGWPLNHHFVFDLLAVGALIVAAVSLLLPKNIEMQRVRKPKDTSEQTLVEDSEDININQERTKQNN